MPFPPLPPEGSSPPLFVDLMCGPNAPLSQAFLYCGWHTVQVDWLLDAAHDLSDEAFQASLQPLMAKCDFVAAALDCSTKSRAREIPRVFDDGRKAPGPLRSDEHPEGLPGLHGTSLRRVQTDNKACAWVLQQLQQAAVEGRGALRENPLRSLHWALPQEAEMLKSDLWWDTDYSACVFHSARCKLQRFRHNIAEIADWTQLQCHHTHDANEWTPWSVGGTHIYPSKEEAEYSATLALSVAVAVSWWAVRVGRAVLHIPRLPPTESVGRREHWLDLDPRSMRQWAMAPLAISLGLQPLDPVEAARVPRRSRLTEGMIKDGLPADAVYVGPGHHRHRIQRTKWSPPFVPGHQVSLADWGPAFIQWVYDSRLGDIFELQGKLLVCDCSHGGPCEADLLAGIVFEQSKPEGSAHRRQVPPEHRATPVRRVSMSARAAAAASIPKPVWAHAQEAVVQAFCKLFPGDWFVGFKFPMVEDLLNQDVFLAYFEWRDHLGMEWDGPLGPLESTQALRWRQRHAEGQQGGALSHKAALPPLLSYGLDMEEHFQQSKQLLECYLPMEQSPLLDDDLRFAAWTSACLKASLVEHRKRAVGVLRELKRRLTSVTTHLRSFQPDQVRAATSKRDLGFVAFLMVACSWPDVTYPAGLILGLPAVGYAPNYGVFPGQPSNFISQVDVLTGCDQHNHYILSTLKPSKDDGFALAQSLKDHDKGFCTPPMKHAELLRYTKGKPFRLIPRHVITQASGKQRIIDDAARGGQSELSSDSNKLVLCNALRPAQHVSAVRQWLTHPQWEALLSQDSFHGAGEDWPDAYRHSPIGPAEALGCVVTFWHEEWQQPCFQVYGSLLFGLPLAVTNFNRYSKFVEAMGRRLLRVLVSLYFDDAHLTDWVSNGPSAQWAFSELNNLLGTPFADEKRQAFASAGTFLGLDFNLEPISPEGLVSFWARDRLLDKVKTFISDARETGKFTPGGASKLYGTLNFLESGMFGRVGCGGLSSIKDHQYQSSSSLPPAVNRSFDLILAVLQTQPKRLYWLAPRAAKRLVAASDAAQDAPGEGSGGFLLLWSPEASHRPREAFVATVDASWFAWFTPGSQKIAQLEMLMVAHALINRASSFRFCRGFWFIDNVASLMCLIRGRSDSEDLEKICHFIHIVLFALEAVLFWEYIPSKSNWADPISREGFKDPWHSQHHFSRFVSELPTYLLDLPFPAVVAVVKFL